jgi:release factor glutamine methyltransferase
MGDIEKEITVGSVIESLSNRLRARSDTPELDAQVLLASVLKITRSSLVAHPEVRLDTQSAAALKDRTKRLEGGEPLPYVLGEWEFFSLSFLVTPDVLIPRPETELLVEQAITWLRRQLEEKSSRTSPIKVLDVGTGSGCIAISLAVNVPGIQVTATDLSPVALECARRNAGKFKVTDRVIFLEADLIPASGRKITDSKTQVYDLIAANLPYIPTDSLHGLPIYGREPTLALDGGADGQDLIRRLLQEAPRILAPGGMVLLEIEASQGPDVTALASKCFPQAAVQMHKDLSGHDRLLEIRQPMKLIPE